MSVEKEAIKLALNAINIWISSKDTSSESLQRVGEKIASGEPVEYEDLGFGDRRDEALAEAFALNEELDGE